MRAKVLVFALCMLITGSINTIATKYQDLTVVGHVGGVPMYFRHPAFQSACMFFGEMLCLIPYFFLRWRRMRARARNPSYVRSTVPQQEKQQRRIARVMAFAIPTLCDACGTTLLNVGLFYTYASTYQMLRGTLVLFAGFFTVLIVRRRLFIHHWLGMVLIMAGAAVVGVSDFLYPASASEKSASAPNPLLGDLLVVAAQAFTALQFILEEKYLVKYKVPALLAVGLEGTWGVVLCTLVLPMLTFIKTPDGLPVDDAVRAFKDMYKNTELSIAIWVSILSIAFFNFFGISVTKQLSGAARATIDACRTLFIWLFCLKVGWEQFHELEILGFLVLVSGTSLYNEILRPCLPGPARAHPHGHHHRPRRQHTPTSGDEAREPLLPSTQADAEPGILSSTVITHSSPLPAPHATFPTRSLRQALPESMSGSDMYTLARSMRLGVSTLSPHSLDSGVLGESVADSFLSITPQWSSVLSRNNSEGGLAAGGSSLGGDAGLSSFSEGQITPGRGESD